MKKKSIFIITIIVFFIGVIITSGFFMASKNRNIVKDNTIQTGMTNVEIIASGATFAPEVEQLEIEKELSIEDFKKQEQIKQKEEKIKNIEIINEAGSLGNSDQCKDISDLALQSECIDNGNLAKAGLEKNITFCLIVKDDASKARCLDDFYYNESIAKNDALYCDKIGDKNLKDKCNAKFVLSKIEDTSFSGNINICNSLTGSDKDYCITKFNNTLDIDIFNQAINSKNISKCEEIKNIDFKKTCSDSINMSLAITNKNLLGCKLILDLSKRKTCENALSKINDSEILIKAINDGNVSSCKEINSDELYTKCVDTINIKIAIRDRDELKCNEITTEDLVKQCLNFFTAIKSQ